MGDKTDKSTNTSTQDVTGTTGSNNTRKFANDKQGNIVNMNIRLYY